MVINPIVGVYIPITRIPIKRWDDHTQPWHIWNTWKQNAKCRWHISQFYARAWCDIEDDEARCLESTWQVVMWLRYLFWLYSTMYMLSFFLHAPCVSRVVWAHIFTANSQQSCFRQFPAPVSILNSRKLLVASWIFPTIHMTITNVTFIGSLPLFYHHCLSRLIIHHHLSLHIIAFIDIIYHHHQQQQQQQHRQPSTWSTNQQIAVAVAGIWLRALFLGSSIKYLSLVTLQDLIGLGTTPWYLINISLTFRGVVFFLKFWGSEVLWWGLMMSLTSFAHNEIPISKFYIHFIWGASASPFELGKSFRPNASNIAWTGIAGKSGESDFCLWMLLTDSMMEYDWMLKNIM